MILESVCYGAGVRALIDFKSVRDPVLVENVVKFAGIVTQAILVSYINGDGAVLP